MGYNHIFFDLDGTLWDFEANSYKILVDVFNNFSLNLRGISDYNDFINIYKKHNGKLWELYNVDKISQEDLRTQRFQRTLADFGIDDVKLSENMGESYVELCPKERKLFPYTFEVLDYLQEKYMLHIITNGFDRTQHIKLDHSNLSPYFTQIITSGKSGFKKPSSDIFQYALDLANCKKEESLYIGDNLVVDILACQDFGIDGIYFNPEQRSHIERPVYEIKCLSEIMNIL